MVGIVTGQGAGLERSSASVLGERGQIGSASMGRGGDLVYVNAATGNLIINRRDEFLVGRGPDTAYAQTYDSSGAPQYAWMQGVYRALSNVTGTVNTAGSTITRSDGDGHNSLYTYDGARGAYVTTEGGGAHDEIRYANGAWSWTDGDSRMTETYTTLSGVPGFHFVSSLADSDGNTQTYSWYSNGTIQRITNANGEYAEFTQTNGLTTQITTFSAGGLATLTRMRYAWDSLRRLSSVTVDLSPTDHAIADGNSYTTTYTYDGSSARIASITQTDGSRLDIAYTQSGSEYRVTKLTQTVSGSLTRVTGLFYDLPTRTTTVTDPLGGATTLRYDSAGNLLQVTLPVPAPGATAPTTSFAYNSNGDVVSVTEAGRTTAYTYDSNGNMLSSRDPAGNTVTRTYGSKNELLTSTEYLVADPDGAGPGAAGTPLTTRYAYDGENHLRFIVSGDGRVTEYRYNPDGSLASTLRYGADLYNIAGLAATTSIAEGTLANWANSVADKATIERTDASYDFRGNISTTTAYSKTLSDGSGDPASPYTRNTYVYDQSGNLLSRQVLGLTGSESFIYDGLNRIVSSTDSAGSTATITFNDAGTTTTVSLAGGTTRVSVFNKAGERISLTESSADTPSALTTSAYDALGRLRMETDPTGKSTYFFYDSASRKIAEISGDGAMTEYGYDSANRLVKSVSYLNRLSTSQIALLSNIDAGGAGGANAGGVNGPTGSTLVANGSFEQSGTHTTTPTGRSNTDLPGWTKSNPETFEQVTSGQMGVLASDGSFWLDLESIAKTGIMTVGSNLLINGGFEQSGSFTTTPTGRSNETLPGWSKTNAETFEQVASGQMGVAASEGSYWLDMESVAKTGMMVVGSNLLVNGSFGQAGTYVDTATGRSHTSIPGWTKANSETFETVMSGQMGVTTLDGGYWLDLESTATTGPQAVGSNLVVNGSFELSTSYVQTAAGRTSTAIPGWSKTNSEAFDQLLSEANPGAPASDGVYSLELDSVPSSGGMVAGPNLLVNGSFEQSAATYTTTATGRMNAANLNIPGWTRASTSTQGFEQVNSGVDGVTATDGSFYLDMESGGGAGSRMDISQTVALTAAKQLTLKFDFANKAPMVPDGEGGFDNSGALEVYWNGILIARIGTQDAALTNKGYTVNGIAGNNTLRFKEVGITDGKGVYLDNVQLYAMVPSPNGGNMDIYQTIANRTAGEVMQLQFDYSSRAAAASGSFEVWWNNTLLETVSDGIGPMKSKSYFVTALAGNNTIRFKGLGTVDALGGTIDNVRLFATQTPPHGGNMDISQVVGGLAAGQVMQLQFDHANRTSAASGSFEVWWNNSLVATIAETGTAMQTKTYQLTAIAGNNTLRFKSLGTVDAAGASLDNVRLFAMVPVPSGGNMDISQTVGGLTAGQLMELKFDHANRTTSASGSFEVWWNNALVATVTSTGVAMQTKTYYVNAIAGNNTLRFRSIGPVDDAGASIDNVRLFATQPVPSGGNMDISQTVGGLTAGQQMQLQFDHANRVSSASGSFEVYWNNALVATVNETGTTMRTKTYYVTAIAGNNTLRFKSLGTVDDAGASIDNVRLFAMQGGSPGGSSPTDALAGLRPVASAKDDWTWRIYDHADRLIETIDAAGRVTTFAYDGASNLVSSTAYANLLAAGTVTGFKTTTPTSTVLPAVNAVTDRATRSFYDSDGRLVGTLDGAGGLTQIFHDAAGQKIREIAYANAVAASLRASGTFAQLLANVGTTGSDRRVDYVYDRRGLVRYTIDALGHPTEFVYDSAGQVVRAIDYAGQIATSGSYTLAGVQSAISSSGLLSNASNRIARTVYDGAGRAAFTIDAEGGTTAFAYDQFGNPIRETRYTTLFTATADQSLAQMQAWAANRVGDAGNRVTRRIYDGAGRLAYSVDGEGYVTERRYDTAGRITHSIVYPTAYSVPDWATNSSLQAQIGATPATAVTTAYLYDSAGRLTDLIDGAGVVTRYVYDGVGQITDQIVAYGTADAATLNRVYDAAGRITAETRGFGTAEAATSSYAYDALGNLLTVTDARGFATSRAYDALGRAVTVTAPIDASANAVTTHAYNRFGEVVQTVDALNNSTYHYYDRLGRRIATRDAEDHVTETGYNVFGETTSVTRRYNKANNSASSAIFPTWVPHGSDATTSFLYDRAGRLTRTTDAMGKYEHYFLNAFGDRTTVLNKLGGYVTNSFDRRGLLLAETLPMQSVDMWGNVLASTVTNRFEYDSRGNRTKRIEADGLAEARTTNWVYDKTDRLIETRRDQVTVLWQGDHNWTYSVVPTETIRYDARGNVIETVDANGARTLYYYDRLNRRIADVTATGTLSTYVNDGNGNVTSTRVYADAVSLPPAPGGAPPAAPGGEYRESSFTYDRLNRLTTTSIAGVRTGAWNGTSYATVTRTVTTTNAYDSNGNITSTTDADGGITYFLYDKLNRAWGKIDPEGWATVYIFDAEGNVTTERRYATKAFGIGTPNPGVNIHADDRHSTFTYDRNGNRLSEERDLAYHSVDGSGNLTAHWEKVKIFYTYNGLGQVTSKTETTGERTDYDYDTGGRLLKERRAGYVDMDGYWVRPTVDYSYDGLNNLTRTRQGGEGLSANDRYTRYTYAKGGRLTQLTDANGAARTYSYDSAGNLVREKYSRTKSDNSVVQEAILYGRDQLGRITSQAIASWNAGGWWDRGDSQNIAYNAFGEVSQRGINGLWQEQFAYDNRGKLWRTNSGDGVWRYFMYDGKGGRTLALESEGADLANLSLDQVLGIATQGGYYAVGATYVDGINATISVLDKRGLAVATRMPRRELSDSGAMQDLVLNRTYNAFGEVASEADARGYLTTYTYNAMGRTVSIKRPVVYVLNENGNGSWTEPTEEYRYDKAGRMIGMVDANGNVSSRSLLAGTGHGGKEALVTAEFHADGGVVRTGYDVFGDARVITNEIWQNEYRSYDGMGRLIEHRHRGGLIDTYTYDLLGQRIRHKNNLLGDANVEKTDYDMQGRVTRHVAFGGDTTTMSYYWQDFETTGMGTFGGWTQVTTYANGLQSAEDSDVFGREIYRRDLGNHETYFSYDLAGRMTQRIAIGAETLNYTHLNSGLLGSVFKGGGTVAWGEWYDYYRTTYSYDANGNRTSENYFREKGYWDYGDYGDPWDDQYHSYVETYQDAFATYDRLNRLESWYENGSHWQPSASIYYEYDAVGNVRCTTAYYEALDADGNRDPYNYTQQLHWYRYDSMNRVVTAKGSHNGSQVVRGYTGIDYTYNLAGQRMSSTQTTLETAWVIDPNSWDPYYGYTYIPYDYDHHRREDFTYDAAGNLDTVRFAETSWSDDGDASYPTIYAPPFTGILKADYTYDLMNRVTGQIDYAWNGLAGYDRSVTYNDKGQISYEVVSVRQPNNDVLKTETYNYFGFGNDYALGAVTSSTTYNYKNGSPQNTSSTTSTYEWREGAVLSYVSHTPNISQSSTIYTTDYVYDSSGDLMWIEVDDGRPRTAYFTFDMNGQAIRRDEYDGNWNQGDPHEVWYRFNGRELGYNGNNGTLDTDYQTSIHNRTRTPGQGAFRYGDTYATPHGDFAPGVEQINSYNQGGAGGSYTVRAGDTLAGIAAQLWGDSSLWYKLAEANGMSGANALSEGQRLTIPSGVMKSRHNAYTFKPYDPAEVIGDASPSTPKPGKRGKCGTFGMVLLVVIAVAVTVITAGAAAAALMPTVTGLGAGIGAVATGTAAASLGVGTMVAIGAGSAALGSIVSQGFGVATGIQNEFSWKAVGMAAIGGGVGAAFAGAFNGFNPVVRGALQGVSSNALTQGIGVVTGLQDKFDWAGVAAAGVGGAVSGALNGRLGKMNKYAAQAVSSGAAAIAASAARTLVSGTSFGDNLLSALPDVIGTTIGNMVADGLASAYDRNRLDARVDRLSRTKSLPESLRGADATEALVRQAIAAGATDADVRAILAATQAATAIGQMELAGLIQPAGYTGVVPLIPRRYTFEGSVEEFARGLEGAFRELASDLKARGKEALNDITKASAHVLIRAALLDPRTGDAAREVLKSFVSGKGPRHFEYDLDDPATAYGVEELFSKRPAEYFHDQVLGLYRGLLDKMKLAGRSYLLEGDSFTRYTYSKFHKSLITNPDFEMLPAWAPDVGISDGVQIGDVVGTMTEGWNVEVREGRLHFWATNSTNMESYFFGNASPSLGSLMNKPVTGPLSTVTQTFRFSWSMPDHLKP